MTFLGMPTAPRGVGHLRGDRPFPEAARDAVANVQLRQNLRTATRTIRDKRAVAVAEVPDWAELRLAGAAVKDETLARLDHYLLQLEQQVIQAGGVVHWARDAHEANALVVRLVTATGTREVVKAARLYLRDKFLNVKVGVSGANFAVAETGTLVVVESEGNGRMCLTLPDVLITVMGLSCWFRGWSCGLPTG